MQPKTAADKRHFARIAEMGCLVCNAIPVELHHVVGYADKPGRVSKRHDRITPLCHAHHRTGKHAVHRLGHRGFFEEHGIDLMAEAERLSNG